jgi:uncharacterized protein YjbI with pentapeptide repeats
MEPGDPETLEARGYWDTESFAGADLSARDLAATRFSECEFVDLVLDGVTLRDARITESRVTRIGASVLTAPGLFWRDVEFEHSRIGSGEMYESEWQSVVLSDCKLGYLNLRGARLRDVRFVRCSFEELDLSDGTATRVAFEECTAQSLDLTRARLEHVDLRGLDLRGIAGIDSMRGVTVSGVQLIGLAPLIAAGLGIQVID